MRKSVRTLLRQGPKHPRLRCALLALATLAAGLTFAGSFKHALAKTPSYFYFALDDAVITASCARNLVDYGFVGVNPSGERIEACSAPLQMMLYAAVYALTHVGYERFYIAQSTVCSLLMGAGFFWILRTLRAGWLPSLVGVAVAAHLLGCSASFLLWHHSGMENAITHVALVATMLVLTRGLRKGRIHFAWSLVPVAAALSRHETIVYIAPVLALFLLFQIKSGNARPSLGFVAAFALLWAVLYLGRAAYFGDFQPNTSYAQDISLQLNTEAFLRGHPIAGSLDVAVSVFKSNLGGLALLALPLMALPSRNRALRFVSLACVAVVLLSLVHPALFGQPRLDPPRTTTHLAVACTLLVVALIATLRAAVVTRTVLVALLAAPPLTGLVRTAPYAVGWQAALFRPTLAGLTTVADANQLHRATVAVADLGHISYAKRFNVVDLGLLGCDVIGKVHDYEVVRDYVLRVAQPDIVVVAGGWADRWAGILNDPRFKRIYTEVSTPELPVVWLRRDMRPDSASPERRLLDDLAQGVSLSRIEAEIERCNADTTPDGCMYVFRATWHVLPDMTRKQRSEALGAFGRIRDPAQREVATTLLNSRNNGQIAAAVVKYFGRLGW